MHVLFVTSSSEERARALDLLDRATTAFVTPGQAIAGQRFDVILHTPKAARMITTDDRMREWYDHLVTRLNPGGWMQPAPLPELDHG